MTVLLAAHLVTVLLALVYFRARIERGLSVTGLALGSLILIHGAPLTIYLTATGPDTFIYEAALSNVDPDEIRARLIAVVSLMFVMVIGGCEFANLMFPALNRRVRRMARAPLPRVMPQLLQLKGLPLMATWVLALSMLAVSVVEGQLPKVIDYFASGESELGKILLRVEGGGTPFYLYNVALAAIAPFMALVLIAAQSGRKGVQIRILLALMLVAVLLGKFGTLSKAPPVLFLLQVVLMALLLKRNRLSIGTALLLFGSGCVLLLAVVFWTIPDLDLAAAFRFMYYRVFDIPNEGLLEYLAAIPATIPHGGGGGIFAFLRANPDGEYIPMYFAVAEVTRDSLISTSNSIFIADAWAEFSWAGVIVFSFAMGWLVRTIDLHAFEYGESDLSACIVAGCAYGVFTLLSTSLNTALVTGGLAVIPLIAMSLRRPRRCERLAPAAPQLRRL